MKGTVVGDPAAPNSSSGSVQELTLWFWLWPMPFQPLVSFGKWGGFRWDGLICGLAAISVNGQTESMLGFMGHMVSAAANYLILIISAPIVRQHLQNQMNAVSYFNKTLLISGPCWSTLACLVLSDSKIHWFYWKHELPGNWGRVRSMVRGRCREVH